MMKRLHFSDMPRRAPGYTLIETVVVVVIVGILAAGASAFIVRSVEGYTDMSRRAALVEAAESALRRMTRDIHGALPNSIRVNDPGTGARFALELLPTLDGVKYNVNATPPCSRLDVTKTVAEFSALACFRNPRVTQHVGGPATAAFRLVVNAKKSAVYIEPSNNTGPITQLNKPIIVTAFDASGLCTTPATGTCGTSNNRHLITLGSLGGLTGHKFGSESPNHRLYVVTTPVSYLCDTTTGTLTRYYNYPILSTQVTTAAGFAAIASSAVVTDRVSSCRALTATVDVRNRGLVTLTLGLSASGETIRLVHQAQLDNSR